LLQVQDTSFRFAEINFGALLAPSPLDTKLSFSGNMAAGE
jgi:hypothetical protein